MDRGERRSTWIGSLLKGTLIVFTAAIAVTSARGAVALHASRSWITLVALVAAGSMLLFFGATRILARWKERSFLILLAAASLLPRVGWVAAVRNEQVSDFAIYHELGVALASGRGYAITGPVGVEDIELYIGGPRTLPYTTAFRPPGVALWCAALYGIFGPSAAAARAANVLLGASVPFLLLFLLLRSRLAELARPASVICALYPTSVMATNLVGTEILFSFFLLTLAFLLERSDSPGASRGWLAAAGLAAGATALVRSMLIPLAASLALALCLRYGIRRGLPRIAAVLLFLALAVAPWTLRNGRVFGRFIPVCTDEGMFLATHSVRNLPERSKTAAWRAAYVRWEALSNESEKAAAGYTLGRMNLREMALAGPAHTLSVVAQGFRETFGTDVEVLFWTQRRSFLRADHGKPEQLFSSRLNESLEIGVTGFYLAVALTALAGAILVRPARLASAGVLFLAVSFVLFAAAHVSLSGQPRYHYSLMPFLILLSSLAAGRFASLRGNA